MRLMRIGGSPPGEATLSQTLHFEQVGRHKQQLRRGGTVKVALPLGCGESSWPIRCRGRGSVHSRLCSRAVCARRKAPCARHTFSAG
ncbi:hypothetical protein KCP70_01370 [Salmonella enterica subsp. enterica]|nr:hypothetical protein KCP70_01370 [Salmonella enterica subsp. enterica]